MMLLKKIFALVLCMLITGSIHARQLSGNLKHHAGQEIKLLGYRGLETIELAHATLDGLGGFSMKYFDGYTGMGYLETSDRSRLFLVLNEPRITINGTHLKEPDSIEFTDSRENGIFSKYAVGHNQREAALAGWKYLLPQYENVDLLKKQQKTYNTIKKEIKRLEKEDAGFLGSLDTSTYVSWYLPMRKLLDDMPNSAQHYVERIPQHIADFRNMDLTDKRLYNSGIFDDLLEGHYWLLENMGQSLDSVYIQMNLSTDYIIQNLQGNDTLLNMASGFLFGLMEKRSLFTASEYLAMEMLVLESCVLEKDLSKQFETYRIMKTGNTAPDIVFSGQKAINGVEMNEPLSFSDLNYSNTLMVFGASWCHKCAQDIPKMKSHYDKWKAKGLEIIFISLDADEKEFARFTKQFPWLSYCDIQGWESKPVQDYHVFSTPTMFLLDKDRKILVRPVSMEQVNAWVEIKMENH